jgi:hypothetical protein
MIYYDMIYDIYMIYMIYDVIYNMIYDMTWRDVTLYIWYDIWYDIWYMIRYDTIWYDIWYMIWYDMIWYMIWYDMIYLTAIGLSPGGSNVYTQTIHRTTQITTEQHKLMWKSAVRAPFLRVLPWHLPYNWGKSTEKPQSGYENPQSG